MHDADTREIRVFVCDILTLPAPLPDPRDLDLPANQSWLNINPDRTLLVSPVISSQVKRRDGNLIKVPVINFTPTSTLLPAFGEQLSPR